MLSQMFLFSYSEVISEQAVLHCPDLWQPASDMQKALEGLHVTLSSHLTEGPPAFFPAASAHFSALSIHRGHSGSSPTYSLVKTFWLKVKSGQKFS